MKRVVLLMIVGLATLFSFGQKKENRLVQVFTGIDASSVFNITVTKGDTESLSIEADDNLMPHVRSEVRNGVLHLYLSNDKKVRNIKTLKASIVMKTLDKVSLSGACKFTANDLFTSDKFRGNCSGASNMAVNVNTGQLSIETSGACKVLLKANVSGDTNLNSSGTSKIQGELKATDVKFSSSGVSSVELTGSATNFKIDVSGVSKVNAEKFAVKTATIGSSGSSKITVNVADALKVNASGTSSVDYKGSPTIDINKSRVAKVRKI